MKKIRLVTIIDDDRLFQFSTKKLLESTERVGNVIQFTDGKEAIEYFIENKDSEDKIPDLIFLDLNMPLLDGWEFLDRFTSQKFKKGLVTIYICSSSNSEKDRARIASYPKLNGFILKPVVKHRVFEALDYQLEIAV